MLYVTVTNCHIDITQSQVIVTQSYVTHRVIKGSRIMISCHMSMAYYYKMKYSLVCNI